MSHPHIHHSEYAKHNNAIHTGAEADQGCPDEDRPRSTAVEGQDFQGVKLVADGAPGDPQSGAYRHARGSHIPLILVHARGSH